MDKHQTEFEMNLRILSSIILFALATPVFASHDSAPGKFYFGIFGGGASSNNINASQYGTVYFIEAQGGPLAVDAFGQLRHKSTAFIGAQIGYQVQSILLNTSSRWSLAPAAELEAYTMSKSTFSATLNNINDRLAEQSFAVQYPMDRDIFIANAVLNFNKPHLLVQPYIGFGIGTAVVKISNANSEQMNPPEAGVNHYNANNSDSTSAFAGQVKLGLNYNLNSYISFFAEYRWLYIARTEFTFGSTVFPAHAATSSWLVKLNAQKYNLGDIGVRINL